MSSQPNDPLADGAAFEDLFAPVTGAGAADEPPAVETTVPAEVDESEEAAAEPEAAAEAAVEPEPEAEPEAAVEESEAEPEPEPEAEAEPEVAVEEPEIEPEVAVEAEVEEALPLKSGALASEEKQGFSEMLDQMSRKLKELSSGMKKLNTPAASDEPQRSVADDRALPPASPESVQAAREDELRAAEASAREDSAREVAAREVAEASAREAAEATVREEAARELAEASAREAAARETAARELAEASVDEDAEAAAREAAAELAGAEDFPPLEVVDPFAADNEGSSFDFDAPEPGSEDDFLSGDLPFGELEGELPPADGGPVFSLPADSPFADDEDAQSPTATVAEGINEHRPAYADLEEEVEEAPLIIASRPAQALDEAAGDLDSFAADMDDGDMPPLPDEAGAARPSFADDAGDGSAALREPMDLLWAIAIVDPEAEASHRSQQAVRAAHTEGAAEDATSRKGKQRVKLDPLPFDALVAGTPLIATIFSPSGGVGKSSTAMNLAVYIAAIADAMAKKRIARGEQNVRVPRVLLLDGDVVQGSLALRLKGDVTPSMHTLMLYLDDRQESGFAGQDRWPSAYEEASPGEKAMRDFVMWPEVLPNLNLLAAPDEPDLFFDFGPKEYQEILRLLSRFYDVVVIDSGTEVIMESNRAWLGHANEVFLMTAPEIDRIYQASKAARYVATSRPHPQDDSTEPRKLPPLVTPDKLSVVLTRYDTDSGIDIEALMDASFPWLKDRPGQRFYVPDVARDMTKANNTGRFLVLENPGYAKVIGQLAKHMFGRYQQQRQRALPPSS